MDRSVTAVAIFIGFISMMIGCRDDDRPIASTPDPAQTKEDAGSSGDGGDSPGSVANLGAPDAGPAIDPYPDAPSVMNSHYVSCGRSQECIEEGRCSDDYGDGCKMPETPEDDGPCGLACRVTGHCEMTEKGCVASRPEHCKDSNHCFRYGICTLDGDRCVAATDEDCEGSILCRSDGQCSAVRGACLAVDDSDCEDTCRTQGKCHAIDGVCQATSDDDCAIPCEERAACTYHKLTVGGLGLHGGMLEVGRCGHGPNPPCKASEVCRIEGRCGFRVERDIGHPWRPPTGQCVATQEGCEASEWCKTAGACHALGGRCQVIDPEHLLRNRRSR